MYGKEANYSGVRYNGWKVQSFRDGVRVKGEKDVWVW